MSSGMGGTDMPLEGVTWLKNNCPSYERKYPFIYFAFNLIFKVEVQAQMKTGNKNIFPFA